MARNPKTVRICVRGSNFGVFGYWAVLLEKVESFRILGMGRRHGFVDRGRCTAGTEGTEGKRRATEVNSNFSVLPDINRRPTCKHDGGGRTGRVGIVVRLIDHYIANLIYLARMITSYQSKGVRCSGGDQVCDSPKSAYLGM